MVHQNGDITRMAGNGEKKRKYGPAHNASFHQPTTLVIEQRTVFVCDPAMASVSMISAVQGLSGFLEKLGYMYDALSIHTQETATLEKSLAKLQGVLTYFTQIEDKVRTTFVREYI